MSVSSEVQRTLVKSPPELWTELSDPTTLARHLGELGEIRIIGTEPERLVVWEAAAAGDGAEVNGRVEIEPSGWGTRVTLTASRSMAAPEPAEIGPARGHEPEMVEVIPETPTEVELAEEPVAETSAEPEMEVEPESEPVATEEHEPPAAAEPEPVLEQPEARLGFFARLFRRRRKNQPEPELIEPEPEPVTAPEPESTAEPEPSTAVEIVAVAPYEPAPQEPALAQVTPEEPAQAEESTMGMDISDELAELEEQTTAVLTAVLDRLGAAHHRPFSRA